MDQPLCKLTLVYPLPTEDQILDLVLSESHTVKGFTTWRAEGHGHEFDKASVSERVRGRIDRGVLVSVLPRYALFALLERVRVAFGGSQLAFWVEPVERYGDLTDLPRPTATNVRHVVENSSSVRARDPYDG